MQKTCEKLITRSYSGTIFHEKITKPIAGFLHILCLVPAFRMVCCLQGALFAEQEFANWNSPTTKPGRI
jgi:hypothetical protein